METATHNLPRTSASLVGRRDELAAIPRRLEQARLVALVGPGGSGKTRLAACIAADLIERNRYPHGVYWVDLVPLETTAQVPQSVLSALGLGDYTGLDPFEGLARFLRHRRALLVLDNCEHVIEACAVLAELLLGNCPHMHILATSRARLGVRAETIWPVAPLTVPPPVPPLSPAEMAKFEAVRLFIERAKAIRPDFALTEANGQAVADICRTLGGLPLAIELAVARTSLLSVGQIAARLDDSLRLLGAGPRQGPARQQTMRAAIDWSHALLSEAEQTLWRRLAVFAGTFSLAAVEAIYGANMLDRMASLVEQSMVQVERAGEQARYRLLEPLRQYAQERLQEAGETESWRRRHWTFYLDWAERRNPGLRGAEQATWRRRFEVEYPNLLAALAWSAHSSRAGTSGLRLAVALGGYWIVSSRLTEGRAWLEEMVNAAEPLRPTAAAGQALCLTATLALLQGDYQTAGPLAEKSYKLALAAEHEGPWGLGYALICLGMASRLHGSRQVALHYLRKGVALFQQNGDTWGQALGLIGVSSVARLSGEHETASTALQESGLLWQKTGDPWGLAFHTHNAFSQALVAGNEAGARALFEAHAADFAASGHTRPLAYMLYGMGTLAYQRRDFDGAAGHFNHSLNLARQIGNQTVEAVSLGGLGLVALAGGRRREAVKQCRAALVEFERLQRYALAGQFLEELAQASARAGHSTTAERLGALVPTLQEAAAANRSERSATGAMATALAELSRLELAEAPQDGPAELRALAFPLTPREREVLLLVAEGLTDPEVALKLAVSPRTVHAHLRSIYRKLDVNTRTAAVYVAGRENFL